MTTNLEKASPEVYLELGGKKHQIIFDAWAYRLLEEELGERVMSEEFFNKPLASTLLVMAWAGLTVSNPELEGLPCSKERRDGQRVVGRWMGIADMKKVSKAIREAFSNSRQETESSEKKKEPEASLVKEKHSPSKTLKE